MKKIFFIITAVFLLFSSAVFAEDYTHIDGEEFYNQTADKITDGTLSLAPAELLQNLRSTLFAEVDNCRSELTGLLVIAALSGILQILKSSEGEKEISEAAFFACFTIMTISALGIFASSVGYGAEVIGKMCDFVTKLVPVFAALLVSGGSVTSAAAFHPIMSAAVYVMTVIVDKCIVPMIYFSAVLGIVGHITPGLKISAFTNLIRSAAKWILTASLTIFTGITAIYGFSAPVFDAVALKGLKFAVGSFVPVVGGILSETVDTVLSGTRLMKSTVGTAGIISLAAITALPIIKILAVYIMLRISAAAAEPVSDKRMSDMLGEIASAVSLILGTVITAAALFIICIAIMLGATN